MIPKSKREDIKDRSLLEETPRKFVIAWLTIHISSNLHKKFTLCFNKTELILTFNMQNYKQIKMDSTSSKFRGQIQNAQIHNTVETMLIKTGS